MNLNFPAHAIGAFITQVPRQVLADLRSRGHSDDAIERMSPEEAFAEYCQWNGLINWNDTLWDAVTALKAIQDMTKADKPGPIPETHQVVVFASEGVTRAVAVRNLPAGDTPCIVVDYDDRRRRFDDVPPEDFERERIGCTREEFDQSATYIW